MSNLSSEPGPGNFARSSSFTRSFYEPNPDEEETDANVGGEGGTTVTATAAAVATAAASNHAPPSPHRTGRRFSRRSMRAGSVRGDNSFMAAAAAAAAAEVDDDDNDDRDNDETLPPPPQPSSERQTSWYTDAVLQTEGTAQDLSAILGQFSLEDATGRGATTTAVNAPVNDGPVTDNDEVLEQYKIMAHVEANIRVQDNNGFDITEYEKRRKVQPENPMQIDYYTGSKKPKPTVPGLRPLPRGMALTLMFQPQEPPSLGSVATSSSRSVTKRRTRGLLVEQRSFLRLPAAGRPLVPELATGVVIHGSTQAIPEGEQAVRCLGCKTNLRVNLLSSLVQCPECKTVSPAGSTRR